MALNWVLVSTEKRRNEMKWNYAELCTLIFCLECRLAQINIRFSFVQMDAYRLKGYWLVGWLAGWLPSLPWLCVSSVNSWYNIRVWLWSYRTNNVRTSDHETSASNALCSYYSFFLFLAEPYLWPMYHNKSNDHHKNVQKIAMMCCSILRASN